MPALFWLFPFPILCFPSSSFQNEEKYIWQGQKFQICMASVCFAHLTRINTQAALRTYGDVEVQGATRRNSHPKCVTSLLFSCGLGNLFKFKMGQSSVVKLIFLHAEGTGFIPCHLWEGLGKSIVRNIGKSLPDLGWVNVKLLELTFILPRIPRSFS